MYEQGFYETSDEELSFVVILSQKDFLSVEANRTAFDFSGALLPRLFEAWY